MKCREAKSDMALYLGHDLPNKSQWEEVRRHVSTCADCRAHYKKLKQTMATLEQSQSEATYEVRGSLWPELSTRLDDQQVRRKSSPKSWLPLGSVVVAALLFVAVMLQPAADLNTPLKTTASKGLFSWDWSPAPVKVVQPDENDSVIETEESKNLESAEL